MERAHPRPESALPPKGKLAAMLEHGYSPVARLLDDTLYVLSEKAPADGTQIWCPDSNATSWYSKKHEQSEQYSRYAMSAGMGASSAMGVVKLAARKAEMTCPYNTVS